MSSRPLISPRRNLYEEDFVAWTAETAQLLRSGRLGEVDIEHVAEELEDMGKSQKRELESRLTTLILHLLKWKHQPDKRKGGWAATISEQRAELQRLFRDSPSLRPAVSKSIREVYPEAVERAGHETGLPRRAYPERCPFTADQILDRNFLPE
jgi:hypothetical protein